jgi:hypothetical protein
MPFRLQAARDIYCYFTTDISLALSPGFTGGTEVKEAKAFSGDETGNAETIVEFTDIYILGFDSSYIVGLLDRYLPGSKSW